jgi:predicted amidohydrolase YtcJ
MTTLRPFPDIILFNASVATQNPLQPTAEAVAIGQGNILAVGTNDNLLHLASAGSKKIDLDGRLVLPGFIDTHIHFYEWALKRQGVKLDDLTCLEDLLARLGRTAGDLPSGQWIMGQGWNESDWTSPQMPTRDILDRTAADHPVLLWRCDLHLAAANSVALKLAGIDAGTPDPPEGRIERDESGRPTGILRELAINLVRQAVAPPSAPQVMAAFADATGALHRRGVTGIHDVRLMADRDGADAFRIFQNLDREDRLTLRSWVTLPGDRLEEIIALGLGTGFGNDRLRVGHVKFFSDGGMGARTAWMIDPYLDADRGMPLIEMDALAHAIHRADAAGLATMVHAVGDRANREVIGIFEALAAHRSPTAAPPPAVPHRIEHVQMIRPEDLERLRRLNLALNVTPANMILDINLIDAVLGDRGQFTYAFRQLLDTGVPVMFSSDCPVCDPDPLIGIHAAVTRQRADGSPPGGWHPHNRVTIDEAIRAYTATPAAVHNANALGVIAPGNKADLVILSRNVLVLPPEMLPEVRVEMTVFDGKIVHRKF